MIITNDNSYRMILYIWLLFLILSSITSLEIESGMRHFKGTAATDTRLDGTVLQSSHMSSAISCLLKCFFYSECLGINWNADSNLCQFVEHHGTIRNSAPGYMSLSLYRKL